MALLVAVSVWVLGLDLWQVVVHRRTWTGTDGMYPVDQLQYQAWIRDASRHLLASDLFIVGGSAHDYTQPLVAIAGTMTALGVAPWLALLLCQPVAVVALFAAVMMWCRRLLPGRRERYAALVLALFFGSFGVLGDEWLPFLTWGYLPTVLSVAAMTGALISYESAIRTGRRLWAAPVLGLLASWLHPWQGEELALILVAVEVGRWRWPSRFAFGALGAVNWRRLLVTLVATSLPLLYYVLLKRFDPIWDLAEGATTSSWPFGSAVLPLVPLIAFAAAVFWRAPESFLGAAARAWPMAVLIVYFLDSHGVGSVPLHAFSGVTVPLAVLAVEGFGRLPIARARWLVPPLVAAATIPATVAMMATAQAAVAPSPNNHNFIAHGEHEALDYLAKLRVPGAVLTPVDLGAVVPAATGRQTYVGDCDWSVPDCQQRLDATQRLFFFRRPARAERAFVAGTGTRFVLVPCNSSTRVERMLAPMTAWVTRFGCAAVIELRR